VAYQSYPEFPSETSSIFISISITVLVSISISISIVPGLPLPFPPDYTSQPIFLIGGGSDIAVEAHYCSVIALILLPSMLKLVFDVKEN
jgi:hypothetical protein